MMDFALLAVKVVLIVVIGLIIVKVAQSVAKKMLERTSLDPAIHTFVLSALRIALYLVLIVVILGALNVATAPLVTVLGACGAAIALALKDSLGNIAGGLMILANKPFKKGDVIDVAGTSGSVQDIDLFATTLKTVDNKVVIIPNGTLNTSVVVNYSTENRRRVDCQFGISYDSDLAAAKDVLRAVAESNPDVYTDPAPFIGVAGHKDSSVAIDLRVWCDTAKYFDVKYYLEEQVKLAFDEANITIPYPQMDVHVVK